MSEHLTLLQNKFINLVAHSMGNLDTRKTNGPLGTYLTQNLKFMDLFNTFKSSRTKQSQT